MKFNSITSCKRQTTVPSLSVDCELSISPCDAADCKEVLWLKEATQILLFMAGGGRTVSLDQKHFVRSCKTSYGQQVFSALFKETRN